MTNLSPARTQRPACRVGLLLLLVATIPAFARAQSPSRLSPDVYFSLGREQLGPSKTDLGPAWMSIGGGVTLPLHRLFAVNLEGHQMLGESLRIDTGTSGRRGVTSMTVGSAVVALGLFDRAVQPFAGVGISRFREQGIGPNVGATERTYSQAPVGLASVLGARFLVGSHLSVRVEYRAYSGLLQYVGVGIGYRWR